MSIHGKLADEKLSQIGADIMGNRSLLEFNHDFCPADDDASCLALGRALRDYMRAADPDELPQGVIWKHFRHHSQACPLTLAMDAKTSATSGENSGISESARDLISRS
jgi:hypothetical protein